MTDFSANDPMTDDPKASNDRPKSHRLLWLMVAVFLLLAIGGMWSLDYFFSPESMASHGIQDAAGD